MNTLPSMQAEGDGVRLRRWATLAGLLLIVFIIAADVHEAWQSYRDVRGQNERVQLAMSRILAEQAARMVQELDVVLANYASWQTSAEGRVADESAMRARLQADVLRLPFVYSAEVTGTDGRVRAATQSDAKDSASLEKRQAFIVPESAQDNALYIGRPFTGRRDGERTFVLSRRINAANGGFAGVVVARVSFAYLAGFYAGIDVIPDTAIRLGRADGTTLAQFPASTSSPADDPAARLAYQRVLQDTEHVQYVNGGGQERVDTLHVVTGYPLIIGVSRPLRSVLQPWVRQVIANGVRTLILAALAALLLAALRAALIRRDRTELERHRLQLQLEGGRRAEALGILAASVAHDFNNVLTAIVGYAELALKALGPAQADAQVHINRLLAASERARRLVGRVLTFDPRRSVAHQPFAINAIVVEVMQQIQATLPASVSVRSEGLDWAATVLGDPTEAHQVIMNLCTNAVRAMPAGGALSLRLEAVEIRESLAPAVGLLVPGRWTRLTIRDTGAGMSPEQVKAVFEPFYSARASEPGTGIGLTVVRNLIVHMQGALDVHSAVGVGTQMSVYWPAVAPPAPAPAVAARRGEGQVIMVVDDEAELVTLVEELLASLGYEPVGFNDAQAALAAFEREPERFHALLTDERMPGLRGCELAIAAHQIKPSLPIVLMTGHRGADVDARVRAAGIAEILDKPLRVQALQDALGRQLRSAPA